MNAGEPGRITHAAPWCDWPAGKGWLNSEIQPVSPAVRTSRSTASRRTERAGRARQPTSDRARPGACDPLPRRPSFMRGALWVDSRAGARCERARGRTINESGPGARGEQPCLVRRQPGMRRVRPDLVVVEPPALEHAAGVSEVLEDLLVQQLVPQPADEALDEGILLGLARRDVVPVEAGAIGPCQDDARALSEQIGSSRARAFPSLRRCAIPFATSTAPPRSSASR
jgi:hypothetical protein